MSTRHTVTLPDGTAAKRTSARRTYSHVVALGPQNRSAVLDRLRAELWRAEARQLHARSVLEYLAAGGELVVSAQNFVLTPEIPNSDPYRGLGWITRTGKFMGVEAGTHADQVSEWFTPIASDDEADRFRAEIEAVEAGPALIGLWTAESWASREALADKVANRIRGTGREVLVLPTVILPK